jgi:hypothetical protein
MTKIPESLKQALREKRVIPFIGAGVSRAVKDKKGGRLFPDWYTLLRNAAEKLKKDGKEAKASRVIGALDDQPADYLDAAKHARAGLGPDWYDYLKETFERPRVEVEDKSLKLASLCWQLGSNLIITGNYEDVQRWTCPNLADLKTWDIQSIKEQLDLVRNGAVTEFPTIWHLHGYIGNVKNLILTPDGYAVLYPEKSEDATKREYKAALFVLRILLSVRPFLFIGFSMDDKQFESQMKYVNKLFKKTSNRHFILLSKDAAKRFEPRDYLEPVVFETLSDLPLVLEEMGRISAKTDRGRTIFSVPFEPGSGYFNVPFRSKGNEFLGREGKFAQIREALFRPALAEMAHAINITGMGGIGKTQLAVEYAYKYKEEYPNGVFWFTADGDMEGQLRAIALENKWVNEFDEPEIQLSAARQKLKNLHNALLVFDNVENTRVIEQYLPDAESNAHVLATSRDILSGFDILDVSALNSEDSVALLTATARRTPDAEDERSIMEIVEHLGGLPLALKIAGEYLRMKPSISYAEYIELLEDQMRKLEESNLTRYEMEVSQVVNIIDDAFAESAYLNKIVEALAASDSFSLDLSLMKGKLSGSPGELEKALSFGVSLGILNKEADAERYWIYPLLARVYQKRNLSE